MSEIKKEEQSDTMQTQKTSYASCTLCPRACHVDRTAGQKGRCHVDARIRVARAALHMWGYPIAKVAAKIALGYTLDEIPNAITGKTYAIVT